MRRLALRSPQIASPSFWRRGLITADDGATARKLPVRNLIDPPYVLPSSKAAFAVETAGKYNKEWLANLPQFERILRNLAYVPPAMEFWHAPTHEALSMVARLSSYYTLAHYMMEHGFFFLISDMLVAFDAPLPHIIYQDVMKALTFCSLQNPPEKQFSLDPTIQRSLLCAAAHRVLLDPDYFGAVEHMFRTMEQQQTLGEAAYSAWVMCCACAGLVDVAVTYLQHMEQHRMAMDSVIFALMMHPSMKPEDLMRGYMGPHAKGLLQQQRLRNALHHSTAAAGVGVHAMFVFYSLTCNHAKKWEVIRHAVQNGVELCPRTLDMAMEIFRKERGLRCGPLTCGQFALALAAADRPYDVLDVLSRMRANELLPEFADDPKADQFSMAYCKAVVQGCSRSFSLGIESQRKQWSEAVFPRLKRCLEGPLRSEEEVQQIRAPVLEHRRAQKLGATSSLPFLSEGRSPEAIPSHTTTPAQLVPPSPPPSAPPLNTETVQAAANGPSPPPRGKRKGMKRKMMLADRQRVPVLPFIPRAERTIAAEHEGSSAAEECLDFLSDPRADGRRMLEAMRKGEFNPWSNPESLQ